MGYSHYRNFDFYCQHMLRLHTHKLPTLIRNTYQKLHLLPRHVRKPRNRIQQIPMWRLQVIRLIDNRPDHLQPGFLPYFALLGDAAGQGALCGVALVLGHAFGVHLEFVALEVLQAVDAGEEGNVLACELVVLLDLRLLEALAAMVARENDHRDAEELRLCRYNL